MTRLIKHGTEYGYKLCSRREEGACAECREVNQRKMALWRESNPDALAQQRRHQIARVRAMRRMARMFPEEFQAILDEELAAEKRKAEAL